MDPLSYLDQSLIVTRTKYSNIFSLYYHEINMDHDHQNSSTYETIFTSLIFSTTIQPLRHCFLGTFQSQKKAFWAPGNASRIASNQTLLKSLSPVQQEHPATGKHRAMSGAVCKLPRLPSLKLTYPLKIGLPKRKLVQYSNHPFSGAMLVSGRVLFANLKFHTNFSSRSKFQTWHRNSLDN